MKMYYLAVEDRIMGISRAGEKLVAIHHMSWPEYLVFWVNDVLVGEVMTQEELERRYNNCQKMALVGHPRYEMFDRYSCD